MTAKVNAKFVLNLDLSATLHNSLLMHLQSLSARINAVKLTVLLTLRSSLINSLTIFGPLLPVIILTRRSY